MSIEQINDGRELRINDDWYVSDIETIDDANEAEEILEIDIAIIQGQLHEDNKQTTVGDWRWRAKSALKFKQLALGQVRRRKMHFQAVAKDARRQSSKSADSLLLKHIRRQVSEDVFLKWIEDSGCNRQAA